MGPNTIGPPQGPSPVTRPAADRTAGQPTGAGFQEALDSALRLSKHASQRVHQRDVRLAPTERVAVAKAVQQAKSQGVKSLVVVLPEAVMLVAPQSNTVVTAMGRQQAESEQRMFTQVDAVVLVGRT